MLYGFYHQRTSMKVEPNTLHILNFNYENLEVASKTPRTISKKGGIQKFHQKQAEICSNTLENARVVT